MADQDRTVDDELLSKLLDDALSETEALALRGRLAREPALAARLEALGRTDAAVRDAYRGIVDEPLPAHIVELLREPDRESGRGNVVELPSRPHAARWPVAPLAAAAGIALAVGSLLGVLVAGVMNAPRTADLAVASATLEPGTELYDVLETAPSSTTRELSSGDAAQPRLTFRTDDGRYCRQLDLAGSARTAAVLACRAADGWRLELVAYGAPAAAGDGGVYRPAAGTARPVARAVDELMAGAPLGADAERAIIAEGWAPPAP